MNFYFPQLKHDPKKAVSESWNRRQIAKVNVCVWKQGPHQISGSPLATSRVFRSRRVGQIVLLFILCWGRSRQGIRRLGGSWSVFLRRDDLIGARRLGQWEGRGQPPGSCSTSSGQVRKLSGFGGNAEPMRLAGLTSPEFPPLWMHCQCSASRDSVLGGPCLAALMGTRGVPHSRVPGKMSPCQKQGGARALEACWRGSTQDAAGSSSCTPQSSECVALHEQSEGAAGEKRQLTKILWVSEYCC